MLDKLIDLLVQWIKLFRIFVVVEPYNSVVITRWGVVNRVRGPGLAWVIPFDVEEIYSAPTYLQTMIAGPQSLMTRDDRPVVVSTMISHSVSDPITYVVTLQGSEQAVEDVVYGMVAKFVMSRTWEQLREDDVSARLTGQIRTQADKYGVRVHRAQFVDLTTARSVRLIQADAGRRQGVMIQSA